MAFVEVLRQEIEREIASDAPFEHRLVGFYVLPGVILAGIPVDHHAGDETDDSFSILGEVVQTFNPKKLTLQDHISIRYDAVAAYSTGGVAEMYLPKGQDKIDVY